MDSPHVGSGRQFWVGLLAGGGFSPVPRWSTGPTPASHEVVVPGELATAIAQQAAFLEMSENAALVAAHAKVLSALTGEREVLTGIGSLPCRLAVEDGPWLHLLRSANQSWQEVLRYQDFPVEQLRAELGHSGPAFETVLDLTGRGTGISDDVVLYIGFDRSDSLVLRCQSSVLDAEYLARVAGYYLGALRMMTTDPTAQHHQQSLLSAAETQFQFDGLAGPQRELPDRRFHELFEDAVRRHPDRVAAVHGAVQWSYAELNQRANQLAHALLARGLGREDVVAVVTERNLDWMAAVLAVFKAGGAYLPVEPHFPPDRIAAMLARSRCRFALTEPASRAGLDLAAPATELAEPLVIDTLLREHRPDTDPGVPVSANQLAYIYFTSGSTGEPKGAMCEQAGMLNHLYAKITDLEIAAGPVVAQTAPQCFDISLWQLISALLVGGRTVIVEQDVVLDVERYLDRLIDAEIEVLQVVPSYLEVVLSHLEELPRELGRLRCVSATGEALKKELVARWFTSYPDIKLVNAYGLTETSDDTNHEVMDRVPEQDRVPLGPAVQNVRVYVVDDQLNPVPLGAPGEIVFSGVCVGRGYINDDQRTKAAFRPDPHRQGERLYRAGDFGRWLPGGKLEFLGRRDAQVKIRGFRIEIGEIENQLLRAPGVRDAAVVVAQDPGGQYLVAFYAAQVELPAHELRALLGAALPEYMVPQHFHCREALPLTGNGKIDKKLLASQASELGQPGQAAEAPRTATERWLAAAWAEVLKVPVAQIGRGDHFFERGGTSLSAVRLLVRLERRVSLAELRDCPTLADLAELVDSSGKGP